VEPPLHVIEEASPAEPFDPAFVPLAAPPAPPLPPTPTTTSSVVSKSENGSVLMIRAPDPPPDPPQGVDGVVVNWAPPPPPPPAPITILVTECQVPAGRVQVPSEVNTCTS
jgi:hypothetical protein